MLKFYTVALMFVGPQHGICRVHPFDAMSFEVDAVFFKFVYLSSIPYGLLYQYLGTPLLGTSNLLIGRVMVIMSNMT
jgi:hypothetical protein